MCCSKCKGLRGFKGYSAYQVAVNNGFVGTEEEWLNTIGSQPLNWFPITLANGWVDASGSGVFYAIKNDILYLRGEITHSTLTVAKHVFWDDASVPDNNVSQDGMCYEKVTSLIVLLRLSTTNTLAYQGVDVAQALLNLNSSTPIRLYV